MTDFNIKDFFKHASEQMRSSGASLGRFCAAKISVGYICWVKNNTEFFAIEDSSPAESQAAARAHAAANNVKDFAVKPACRVILLEGTDINNTEYPLNKDRTIYIAASQDFNPTTEQWEDGFGWTLWLEKSVNVENGFDPAKSGQTFWIQQKNAIHPDYDPDVMDEVNSDPNLVDNRLHREKWEDGMGTGEYGPRFYPYAEVVFDTREELVEYALSLGVDVVGAAADTGNLSVPMPDGWTPGAEIWADSLNHFAGVFNGDDFSGPLPVVKPKLQEMHEDWKDTGLTLDDLISVWKAVRS